MRCTVIVPTLNAAGQWPRFAAALETAAARTDPAADVLILDSSSDDGTAELARRSGFRVHTLARSEFNHGRTRQLGVDLCPESECLVFLTHDALLAEAGSIVRLVEAFDDPAVGAAYGRQLPHHGAGAVEAHARLFNYPEASEVRSFGDRGRRGLKTAFLSNSFAAYRRAALTAVGGFPDDVIFGEDMVTAGRMLVAGWKIAYVAEAAVHHSHGYGWRQDLRRAFDIGVLHRREGWLLREFGVAEGEGKRFVLSELRHLRERQPAAIPGAVVATGCKLLGYRLGRLEHRLPVPAKRHLSMNRAFWSDHA